MKLFHKILTIALLGALPATAFADEAAEASPYSMLGYGSLNDNISASQRAMGGIGYALRSKRQINVKNPASYAAIDSMTFLFDIGANVGSVNFTQTGMDRFSKTLGGLDYVTLQVPIGKWMGASAGLLPYSSRGYTFGMDIENGTATYDGKGGISEAYLGFAARPVKGLSLGFNIGYLFGNLISDETVTATGGQISMYEQVLKVRDYNLQFGLQYGLTFAREHTVTIGATYTLGKKTHGDGSIINYDLSEATTRPDTIGIVKLKDGYSMPWSLGAGISYQWGNRLIVGADFTYQPWSKAQFNGISGFNATKFANRYKGAVGAEYTPATRGNYFKRMSYRIGANYERDYVMVGDNHVKEFGISCGFGFPTPGRTAVNLGFEYRHRNSSPVKTVGEDYYMVTLGVAINEIWFVPSRIR
ncbi:MAG: hypothetical protein NC301_06435 [Bacteroides sp.]|nr:hypothetical protein [Bacteroides sp.]MCM1378870.1 hypothetical protein [Bacteroides sp.]MCM1445486.1 hypothetical protein [Prevotella sp.]